VVTVYGRQSDSRQRELPPSRMARSRREDPKKRRGLRDFRGMVKRCQVQSLQDVRVPAEVYPAHSARLREVGEGTFLALTAARARALCEGGNAVRAVSGAASVQTGARRRHRHRSVVRRHSCDLDVASGPEHDLQVGRVECRHQLAYRPRAIDIAAGTSSDRPRAPRIHGQYPRKPWPAPQHGPRVRRQPRTDDGDAAGRHRLRPRGGPRCVRPSLAAAAATVIAALPAAEVDPRRVID
jgi:hypothetical protein